MPRPLFLIRQIEQLNILRGMVFLLGSCFIANSSLSDSNHLSVKKNSQKISSEFLEFVEEFSDDEDSVVHLLAEDLDGNILIGGNSASGVVGLGQREAQSSSQENVKSKQSGSSKSSAASSNVGGVKL